MLLTLASPSSAPVAMLKVTVVSVLGAVTVAVWADEAWPEPALLLAVTVTRRVEPTSAAARV